MQYLEKLESLRGVAEKNAILQLDYAIRLNEVNNGKHSALIEKAVNTLYIAEKKTSKAVEEILMPLKSEAKSNTVICAAHAHIDMNWMWGYDETVAITLSTVETMLNLMEKYPSFIFSQSQASVYEIVASHRPDLLNKIKTRIKENRWEVTAGAFVECDKNMSSTESQINQVRLTKEYLSQILEISPDTLKLDFEPDTFGHNEFVPEILSSAGIKYYYHCRGNTLSFPFYYWRAGESKILVYREPQWYNWSLEDNPFIYVPDFCSRHKVNKVLKVYGVGNHGGGATARDIERILNLKSLPIMPTIKFGTYVEFYDYLSTLKDVPEVSGEQNPIFSGCYTSQSKIKQANAADERAVYTAQILTRGENDCPSLFKAKRNTLFNQFHDILPGSGKEATRIHALALSQETKAICGAAIGKSLSSKIKNINTAPLFKESGEAADRALGAGVGYSNKNLVYLPNFSSGKERAFVAFNPNNEGGKFLVNLDLWDYEGNTDNLEAADDNNNILPLVKRPLMENYWSHDVFTFSTEAVIPAFGYTTIMLREKKPFIKKIEYPPMYERQDVIADYTFENEFIKAKFDERANLVSFIDKRNGVETIGAPSNFIYSVEDGAKFMSAWVVGARSQFKQLDEKVNVHSFIKTEVATTLNYTAEFNSSYLKVTVTLPRASDALEIKASLDFFEKGVFGKSIPRFDYRLNTLSLKTNSFLNQLAFINRPSADADAPALNLAQKTEKGMGVMLAADGKYGFRLTDDFLEVCLCRASYDPDPLPEYGTLDFNLFISGAEASAKNAKIKLDKVFNPIKVVAASKTNGELKTTGALLKASGGYISGREETPSGEIITVLNYESEESVFKIEHSGKVSVCDSLGKELTELSSKDGAKIAALKKHSVTFIKLHN